MVNYPYSNESLDAIVKGMKPSREDDIIAICGAGDQAFALLEYANSVIAIDCDARQIAYAKARAEALKARDYEGFFPKIEPGNCLSYTYHKKQSEDYFSTRTLLDRIIRIKPRLERIRSKLNNLEFWEKSLQEFVKETQGRKYSKAYLSNALTFSKLMRRCQWDFVEQIAAKLRNPGIIYLADGGEVYLKHMYNLEEDKKLTEIAMEIERKTTRWRPAVFRRKA
jgi:hypothetical protein